MHIYSYLKNTLCDNDNFIAILPNKIYFYNILKIDKLSNNNIIILFKNKIVDIKGNNLKPFKCLDKELLINGIIESVNFYEK